MTKYSPPTPTKIHYVYTAFTPSCSTDVPHSCLWIYNLYFILILLYFIPILLYFITNLYIITNLLYIINYLEIPALIMTNLPYFIPILLYIIANLLYLRLYVSPSFCVCPLLGPNRIKFRKESDY